MRLPNRWDNNLGNELEKIKVRLEKNIVAKERIRNKEQAKKNEKSLID
jgi:hypothetical protein